MHLNLAHVRTSERRLNQHMGRTPPNISQEGAFREESSGRFLRGVRRAPPEFCCLFWGESVSRGISGGWIQKSIVRVPPEGRPIYLKKGTYTDHDKDAQTVRIGATYSPRHDCPMCLKRGAIQAPTGRPNCQERGALQTPAWTLYPSGEGRHTEGRHTTHDRGAILHKTGTQAARWRGAIQIQIRASIC